jgi:5-methylcytosine-specific restriction endonuclease McrA
MTAINPWTAPHPKPTKGTAKRARKAKRTAVDAFERKEKAYVRQRDGGCCRFCGTPSREVCHIVSKGMGGDHGIRSSRENLIVLCEEHHRGPILSLHAGTLKAEPDDVYGFHVVMFFTPDFNICRQSAVRA